ncbi:MAG: hypothetical protein ACXABY_02160 [Candidatus Thorarchaeota archaeon]|jgi:hypothetical protein
MSRLGKHKKKLEDNYSFNSKKKLKAAIEHKMKRIYVGILDALEKEKLSGNIEAEVFDILRSKILNMGNDQVRSMKKELDERYNVEFLTYHVVLPVKPLGDGPSLITDGKVLYEG